jgi:hypothetical protein
MSDVTDEDVDGLNFKGLLAAIGFNAVLALLAFSVWAEWGPYEWAAAAQLAVMDSYGQKLTLILVLFLFVIPGALLLAPVLKAGRLVWAVAFGLPAVALALHFAAMSYFLATGGPASSPSFADAVDSATFLPRAFTLKTTQLAPLDVDRAAGIHTSHFDDEYIPFVKDAWPANATPVVLESKASLLDGIEREGVVDGNIRRAPLPYLVRRAWGPDAPTLGIIVTHGESVRDYWLLPAIFYVLALLYGAWRLWKMRRAPVS